jgi:zinc transport system substrate-binding protein
MMKYLGIIIMVLALTGCAAKQEADQKQEQGGVQQDEKKISVVASFYPLAYMAERIGGDVVEVKNIIGASDPHDYVPSPGDVTSMHDADVVILQGADYEPWGEDIAAQLEGKDVAMIQVASKLDLNEYDSDEHAEEHEDEHEDEEEDHADDEHGHEHGEYDPHTWLDPVLAMQMVDVITSAMVDASGEHAEVFRANAATLRDEFAALDAKYKEGLENCARDEVIVSHDAYGYLSDRYGITMHAIAGISTQDEPSAEVLATLKDEAAEGMTHILTEENSVKRFAQTLASETGLTMLPFDPLAVPAVNGETDMIDRARMNLVQLQLALGCDV